MDYAICGHCNQPMDGRKGCTPSPEDFVIGGVQFEPVPFGQETDIYGE
jgi:hypothetical protein